MTCCVPYVEQTMNGIPKYHCKYCGKTWTDRSYLPTCNRPDKELPNGD